MKPAAAIALLAACLLAAPAGAAPGGRIGTLEKGHYVCELPGDAGGEARIPQPEEDFTVVGSSSYRAKGVLGSYLRTGDQVVMTSGPFRGRKFHRLSDRFLRQLAPDGSDGPMRCILVNRNGR